MFPGVDGVDVVIGTSSFLREFSHGKDMAYITKTAIEVINFVKSKGNYQKSCQNSVLRSHSASFHKASKSDSLQKIHSDQTWLTSFRSTKPSIALV